MSGRNQRGLAVSVEAAVVLPVLVLFIGLLLTLARIALAEQSVGAVAAAGARAASLERSQAHAGNAAREAVAASLAQHGLTCADHEVEIDAAAISLAPGQRGSVRVSVTCVVDLSDVTLPFMPGSLTVDADRRSPVDPLRAVRPQARWGR
ncbi:pilus assembly protein TadE [Tessaracoccus sp. HDW20]|uniref:TadE/TadG family type IV pilus assembly protein n=1 Tax=Tessaracoccus coleopterorum TaxID=2714950 RepID=UPI0018D2A94E|nr:TadE/TadG family type IV pilus assembly protein [Tessaracoccus coleopterorum]NHB83649.1 pilus assembly protein TadE [Tessaracoccus coleopterorum]